MYTQSVLILCVFVAGCYGFYMPPGYGGSSANNRRAVCSLPTKPCRIQVTMTPFDSSEPTVSPIDTEMCSCNGHGECPSDWGLQNQVIQRSLISHTSHMTLNMMFCQPITPPRFCNYGEKALIVYGSLTIPTNVEEYNCRCHGNAPLQLDKRIMRNFQPTHEYVCDYFKQTCPYSAYHCLVIREGSTDYTCKCPNGLTCQASNDNPSGMWTYPIYGYCR